MGLLKSGTRAFLDLQMDFYISGEIFVLMLQLSFSKNVFVYEP